MTVIEITAWEGAIMKSNRHRWTVFAIAVWVLALGLTTVLAPATTEAEVYKIGWMVYTPNHPNGCAPLPFDCYVLQVWGNQ
jgi:heme/copper-type cytochrome/quinol oxidase subunit 1